MRSLLVRLLIQLGFAVSAVVGFLMLRHSGLAVIAVAVFTYIGVVMVVLAIMLNYPRMPRRAAVNEFADELDARNLLLSERFHVDRAFRVEGQEGDSEGPHYFLELEQGGVLHLCGNYLYDYEPNEDEPRHFPCTEFTIRRHAELGYVVDIISSGLIIEPELEFPAFDSTELEQHRPTHDGEILCNVSYDQLLRERIKRQTR